MIISWQNVQFLKSLKLCILIDVELRSFAFKGVLHPRAVFGLFLHLSQKLQHIGDK